MAIRTPFQNSTGDILSGRYDIPDKGSDFAVIMCTGYNAWIDHPIAIKTEKELLKLGIAVFRFPYFGQGRTPDPSVISVSECLDDTMQAYMWVSKRHEHVGFLGVSLGGLAAILASAELKEVWALGLTCPALNNLGEVLAKIYGIDMEQWKKDKKFLVKKLGKEIPYSVFTDALKYDVFAAAEKISCPARLIIGTEDQYIPLRYAEEFVRRAANCEFNFVPGANHTFSNGTGRFLFEAMMEFFREQKYLVENEKSHLLEPE